MHLFSCSIHRLFLHQKVVTSMRFMLTFTYAVYLAESQDNRHWCLKKTGNTILNSL